MGERRGKGRVAMEGEATWAGITYTHDLKWNKHTSKKLTQAERAWGAVQRLGTSRGGLSQTQLYTSSIRAIANATYG